MSTFQQIADAIAWTVYHGAGIGPRTTIDPAHPASIGDVSVSGWGLGNKAATMGIYTNNGTVFTAATTDWARVLASGTVPAVEQITRNVLDRLGRIHGQQALHVLNPTAQL